MYKKKKRYKELINMRKSSLPNIDDLYKNNNTFMPFIGKKTKKIVAKMRQSNDLPKKHSHFTKTELTEIKQ